MPESLGHFIIRRTSAHDGPCGYWHICGNNLRLIPAQQLSAFAQEAFDV
jgi:hypothetical protein